MATTLMRPIPKPRTGLIQIPVPPVPPVPKPRLQMVLPVAVPNKVTCDLSREKRCKKVDRWTGELQGRKFTLYVPHTVVADGEQFRVTIIGDPVPPLPPGSALFQLEKMARSTGDDKYKLCQTSTDDWGDVYLPQSYRQYKTVTIGGS